MSIADLVIQSTFVKQEIWSPVIGRSDLYIVLDPSYLNALRSFDSCEETDFLAVYVLCPMPACRYEQCFL